MYVPARVLRKKFSVSYTCLRNWAITGKVDYRQTPGGVRLYNYEEAKKLFTAPVSTEDKKESIIYARVSSSHQKEDLERQVSDLQHVYPNHRVIKDIGSGLNFERKGLQTLLDLIFDGSIRQIVVAYKDRLCRFGFEMFEAICRRFEVQIVVHDREETGSDKELSEDLLAVVNFFVARNNGRRSSKNRKRRRHQGQDTDLPTQAYKSAASGIGPVVRSLSVDL